MLQADDFGRAGSQSNRSGLATPALLVDVEALDRNIAAMQGRVATLGVKFRPHAKAHKCVEIAQRLRRAGALGASCATMEEAETMAHGGLDGILITSPLAAPWQLERLRRLLLRGADIMSVVDCEAHLLGLASAAESVGRKVGVLVEVDVGVGRTGCLEVGDIVALARQAAANPALRYEGVQAYWGNLQQIMPLSERTRLVEVQLERVRGVLSALREAGLTPAIVTGAGTGTFGIDAASGLFTEIQPGSFLFMDSCYGTVDLGAGTRFEPSLFVAATVVSSTRPGRVIVNAGFKAFATDSGLPVPVRGAPAGATYRFMGDEHGAVDFTGEAPALGATIEFLTSHCDPTVNLYPAFDVVRGPEIVDRWPILARYGNSA